MVIGAKCDIVGGVFFHCRNDFVDIGVLWFGEVVCIIILVEEVEEVGVGVVIFID